jgi:hypothetical protein
MAILAISIPSAPEEVLVVDISQGQSLRWSEQAKQLSLDVVGRHTSRIRVREHTGLADGIDYPALSVLHGWRLEGWSVQRPNSGALRGFIAQRPLE